MLDITVTGERVGLCGDPWWLYQAAVEAEHDGDEDLAAEYYVALSKEGKISPQKHRWIGCTGQEEVRIRTPRGLLRINADRQVPCFEEVWRALIAPPGIMEAIRSLVCAGRPRVATRAEGGGG